jgi:hypothetical protein
MINVSDRAFDDFSGGVFNKKANRKILGLE